MKGFGMFGFLAIILAIAGFVGKDIGSIRQANETKRDCDRHGAIYLEDIRYSCKQEDHQATKEPINGQKD